MASTYVNDLRLNEMATGDQSGSWGTVTNTNLELIGEAFSYGTEAITTNADTHATTIADGASDPGRAMFLKYTGTLDSACTITIGPNTVSKMWFIENATSGSQNIIISQGSGANVTIPAGQTKAVYSDGAGSGAAFVDAFAALSVGAISGTSATFDGGVDIDNINIDGTTIALSSGDLTLDTVGNIVLDADNSGSIHLKDNSVQYAALYKSGNNFVQYNPVTDGDIILQGLDGASTINALTLDMSDAGTAIFNNGIKLNDSGRLFLGNDSDAQIYNTGSHTYIQNYTTNQDIIFNGVDDGSSITALTLDMSDAGTATFNHDAKFSDNGKAIFGAAGDLSIYHDGTNSYIKDAGTGGLVIQGESTIYFQVNGGSEDYMRMNQNGAVDIYYDGAVKLSTTSTGIDVTGTAVTDGVTVDGTLRTKEVYEFVDIGTSTTGTIGFNTSVTGILYLTANQTANRTINLSNVNANLDIGRSITCAVLLTQGSTAYYLSTVQVDGSTVTPKWQGGSAPTAGNASGIDSYSFTIIKTANATFTVLASQTQFA